MTGAADDRPAVWVGHIATKARDLAAAHSFYEAIGMRTVFRGDDIVIMELRGGTHLVVQPDATRAATPLDFDLMVDDLATTHAAWGEAGITVSPITSGSIHDMFTVRDPDGNTINVFSTHVVGTV
jgi:catechol 2,3-dioxygenase-like lactoylglutathione lyase family enzyme